MRSYQAAVVAIGLGLSVGALAQDVQGDFNIVARGGVGVYTGDLGRYADAGPAWGVNVNLQPTNVMGLEIGYEGSRNEVNDARLTASPAFMRHGGTVLLRLAPPFLERVRPYVAAGLGLSHVSVPEAEVAGLYQDDFMEEIPLAGGLELNAGPVTAGLRATYRWLIDDGFADRAQAGDPEGGLFDAVVTLGGRF